jgi:hypothetical protein
VFGARRVNEYLLQVVETQSDFRKAGTVNALYWAAGRLSFPRDARSFTDENATAESRAAYEELADVWEWRRILFLEMFVCNANVDVRRSIIAMLNLTSEDYPEALRPLVAQAVEIAQRSEDEYIRHRVEVQLGDVRPLKALPHRQPRSSS